MKKENIVFDLGGVIEHIDPKRVIKSFEGIGVQNASEFFSLYRQSKICSLFETGHVFAQDFIEHISSLCGSSVTDEVIVNAWCANQLGVEPNVLSVIRELKNRSYKLYILSNTNPIHYERILYNFYRRYNENFEKLFDEIYLSYNIGKRKPGEAAYQHLVDNGILPEKSTYIDDLEENLSAPKKLGFSTLHHKTNEGLEYLLELFP